MKIKEKYNVFLVSTFHGDSGEIVEHERFMGETWAVSEAQAENNVRFRNEGAVLAHQIVDLPCDTAVFYSYRAVLANTHEALQITPVESQEACKKESKKMTTGITLHCDIETYSSVDITKAGLYRYAESPDFEILLIAYAIDDGSVQLVDLAMGEDPQPFLDLLLADGTTVHAYNAAFELACLSTWLERSGRWSTLNGSASQALLPRFRCTMAHAMYCGYPAGLAATGEALGLPAEKQKLAIGRKLIDTFCKPAKRRGIAGSRVTPQQEPEQWTLFQDYCRQDVEAEREIGRRLATFPLPEREQLLWQQDLRINAGGVAVDLPFTEAAIWCGETVAEELRAEASAISGLDNPNSVSQLTTWLNKELSDQPDLTDLRKETVAGLLEQGIDNVQVERMLEIRQQLGKSSNKKYDAIEAAACADHRVRGLLQYYGARTGRWAGRLVQIQNLPRNYLKSLDFARELVTERRLDLLKLIYGNVPDVLSQLIRTAFVPAPGHHFVVADFSAIEARVLAWLAQERWVMDVFAGDGRIYEATAAAMFGVPVDLIRRDRPEYELRQKGKVATLALGYQGGVGALEAMGALYMGLDEEELPDLVDRWRKANPAIVALWEQVNQAALSVITPPHRPVELAGCRFTFEHNTLVITLPSGRPLFYDSPTPTRGKFGGQALKYRSTVGSKWGWVPTFGGKLVENIVQAIARDCLAKLLLRLFQTRHWVSFHVHDEVVLEVPEGQGPAALAEALELMSQPLPWAPGLILKGDGFVAEKYYRKD